MAAADFSVGRDPEVVPGDSVGYGRSKTSKSSSESTTSITLTVSSSCARVVSSSAMHWVGNST